MTDALTEQIRSIPLPSGWIEQFDNDANHPFWVDTNAKPARSIWTHPYEDEEYVREHPQAREEVNEVRRLMQQQTHGDRQGQHRDSSKERGYHSTGSEGSGGSKGSAGGTKKKGFMEKIKDKAIGTKEEREQQRRVCLYHPLSALYSLSDLYCSSFDRSPKLTANNACNSSRPSNSSACKPCSTSARCTATRAWACTADPTVRLR